MTSVVRHRQQAWKWNAPTDAVDEALDKHRAHAEVITGSETNAARWGELLEAPGWATTRKPGAFNRGDVYVTRRTDLGPSLKTGVGRLSITTYDNRASWVAYDIIDRPSGPLGFMALHLPAHIERILRDPRSRDPRVRAYREALTELRTLILQLRKEHDGLQLVVAGDWNLDFRKAWVRDYIAHTLRGTGLKIPKPPAKGSHGRRLIDWALTDLESRGEVLPLHRRASDHHPVAFTHRVNQEAPMSYREAKSLATLLVEVNKAAPNRSKVSDGWIGDPAHSSRVSDHNPNAAGVVRARDFTHDPDGGLDCNELAADLVKLARAGTHPALGPGSYIIWNRRIASATDDGRPWDWEPYTGTNPHDHHLHVSVATAAAGYDSTKAWGVLVDPPKPTPRWDDIAAQAKAIVNHPDGRDDAELEDAARVLRIARRHSIKH